MNDNATIFGLPVAGLINQVQNLTLVALSFFVSRGYMSGDQLGTLVSAGGVILTLAANAFTHSATGGSASGFSGKPNGVGTGASS